MRLPVRPSLALLAGVALLSVPVAPALADTTASPAAPAEESGFEYWAYVTSDGEGSDWVASGVGAGESVPADGTVEGWRFANHGDPARLPRALPTFDELCADAEAGADQKAVGVVVDTGTEEDADGEAVPEPVGGCAVVDADASGLEVVEAVTTARLDDGGFVCGLADYPAQGCGEPVPGEVPTDDDAEIALSAPDDTGAEPTGAPTGDATDDTGSTTDTDTTTDTADAATDTVVDAADSGEGGLNWIAIGIIVVVVVALAAALTLRSTRRGQGDADLS